MRATFGMQRSPLQVDGRRLGRRKGKAEATEKEEKRKMVTGEGRKVNIGKVLSFFDVEVVLCFRYIFEILYFFATLACHSVY